MATIGIETPQASPGWVGRRFYLFMAIVIGAVIIAGFSRTVPGALAASPGLPILLHIHGAVFLAWLVLFVVQPALSLRGALKLHRQLGLLGSALAVAMVIMGAAATFWAVRTHAVPDFFPPGVFLAMNLLGVTSFGALVAAGVVKRREGEWHKRLMLCATALLLGPGLGRLLPMNAFGPAAPLVLAAVQDAILLAGPIADVLIRRRIHPAYGWGVGVVVLSQVLTPVLGFSPPVLALVRAIAGPG